MKTAVKSETDSDARLVERCRGGDQDAFARIVERYQSLICSLTFGACGHLQTSEDLAQTTFITAWHDLSKLQEPSRLKSWLCGIARNVTNSSFRQQRRTPTANAKGLDETADIPSKMPLPREHAITREEERLLWRAMESLPVSYREPLVLFYRQQQSAAEVAEVLGLSENAVHQRLSRGRAMLTEQMANVVETALHNSGPDETFTFGVLAALPLAVTSAKIVTAGATAKAAGSCGLLKTLLGITPLASIGAFLGYKMSKDAEHSPRRRELVVTFWRIVVGCLVAFVAIPFLLPFILAAISVQIPKETLFAGLTIWLGILYPVVTLALIVWAWKRCRKFPLSEEDIQKVGSRKKKRFATWVLLAVIGSACLLILICSDTHWKVQHPSPDEVRQLITDAKSKDVQFAILEYPHGKRLVRIYLLEDGKRTNFFAPADESLLALLTEKGIAYPTYVQGRDFEVFGWPGKFLVVFCILVLAMGSVILLRHRRR